MINKKPIKGLDNIYVLNYEPLKERRNLLGKLFKKFNLVPIWNIHPASKKSTKKELTDYAYDNKKEFLARKTIGGAKKISKLNNAGIEIIHDHFDVWKKIIKNKEIAMVFEDDAILEDNFAEKAELLLKKLKRVNWDICHICYMQGEETPKKKSKVDLMEAPNRNSRTGAGYIINPKGAKKLLSVKKYVIAFDWEIRYRQKLLKMDVFWSNPHLVYQGSKYGGFFSSAIEDRTKSTIGKLLVWIESKRFNKNVFFKVLILMKDKIYKIMKWQKNN